MELWKLVIVDDEPIILKGLVETYDWEDMGFSLAGTAENGEAALELIRRTEPDLVLTDVRMKKMTGLDLIERVREFNEEVLFVVISAYRDFEYARKACEVGAFSYLLKPVEEEKLREVIGDARALCEKRKREQREKDSYRRLLKEDRENVFRNMLKKYLCGDMEKDAFEEGLLMFNKELGREDTVLCVCADLDISCKIMAPVSYENERAFLFRELEQAFEKEYSCMACEERNGARIYFLNTGRRRGVENVRKILKETANKLDSPMISAVSGEFYGTEGILKSYHQAVHFFGTASEAGANGFTLTREQAEEVMTPVSSSDAESFVINAIRKNDKAGLKEAFVRFLYALPSSSQEEHQRRAIHKLAVSVESTLQDTYGLTPEVEKKFQNLYAALPSLSGVRTVDICYRLFCQVIDERQNKAQSRDVTYFNEYMSVALAYIDEHLSDDELSLSAVAAAVYLNPVYFGRVFKNTLNMSFKRYVLQKRMELAKALILEGNEGISVICERVGIPNRSYFTQIFKQYTGVLPSEYRKEQKE